MKRLVIFGCGNFARVAHYYFQHDSEYTVVAFAVDEAYQEQATFQDLPVVPFETVQDQYSPDAYHIFIALGLRELNNLRAQRISDAGRKGYRLASYVSSGAVVPADLHMAPNVWIMETAHIHPFVELAQGTIIWSRSTIGFGSRIGENCWIAGGLCGESVKVGECTFIGLGATVASFLSVGKGNVIGAGALILKDTGDFEVYKGRHSDKSPVPSTRFGRFNG